MNKTTNTLRLFALLLLLGLLSACGGGIFGTGDGGDIQEIDASEDTGGDGLDENPDGVDDSEIDQSPDAGEQAEGSGTEEVDGEGEQIPVDIPSAATTLSFSNNTPSGLDPFDNNVPALKVINLTEFDLSALSELVDNIDPAVVEVSSQSTSSSLAVNIGESSITVLNGDTGEELVNLEPLNASEDSLTTLIIAQNDEAASPTDSALTATAVDTRAVSASSSMAEVRVIYIVESDPESIPEITLSPVGDNPNGSSVVLHNRQIAEENLTTYELVNSGSYALSTSDDSFSQQLITAEADSVITFVITGQSLTPVYVEVDSLP